MSVIYIGFKMLAFSWELYKWITSLCKIACEVLNDALMHKLQELLLIGESRRNKYGKIQKKTVRKNVYIRLENRKMYFNSVCLLFLSRTLPCFPPNEVATQALNPFFLMVLLFLFSFCRLPHDPI